MARDDPEEGILSKTVKILQQLTPLTAKEDNEDYRISLD